ncbi:hypothetical protein SGLAM104S_09293 [Streptomyces glaucescens]
MAEPELTERTLIELDALGPNGPFAARNRVTLHDVAGRPVARLGLVPKLFVTRTMAALHRAEPLPFAERIAALWRSRWPPPGSPGRSCARRTSPPTS